MSTKYYEVALPLKLKSLSYSSPLDLTPGESVFVPLRNQQKPAVVLKQLKQKPAFETKAISGKDTEREKLSPARLQWLCWMADYYQHSLGAVISLSFPPRSKPPKGVTKQSSSLRKEVARHKVTIADKGPTLHPPLGAKPLLTEEQQKSLQEIQQYKGFRTHLLHGVTGSGKTEIFFRLIEPVIRAGKSALILVPEIALTPQHIKRFSSRFPGQVACFHSGLSPKEKRLQWTSLIKRDKKILIGPRSALFCPLPQLAWIIVDEEHAAHFKQEEQLKYQGRDSAVYLAKCLHIPIVLASATPSLESWHNARTGKYIYHSLKKPVFLSAQNQITTVDMKKEKKRDLPYWLSETLYFALKQSLKNKEQSALFLNRRGESTFVFCSSCAYSFSCANCDISLTQHQSSHLLCHYCGFRREKPSTCPKCQKGNIFSFGVGTATLQKELEKLFPSACIRRADRDEIKNYKQWSEMLNQMENKEIDILIGTQMITKGLDFPYLNLVGLILADQGLNWPDFRSGEKSFQLMMQMAGRAGRRKKPSQVILQSYNLSHYIIKDLQKRDYGAFAEKELKQRKKHGYPPFGKLTLVRVQSLSRPQASKTAENIKTHLISLSSKYKFQNHLQILGPAPAPHFRLKNQYRYHILLKSPSPLLLKQAGELVSHLHFPHKVRVHINRDPVYMF